MVTGFVNLEDYAKDFAHINYQLLHLLRDIARQDKVLAAMKFGVSAQFVDRISRATLEDLQVLAKSSALSFQPKSSVALDVLLGAVLSPGVTAEQVEAMRQAALLADGKKEGMVGGV